MSGRVVSADTNSSRRRVVYGLENSSSYEPTGEKNLVIDEVYAKKIKVKAQTVSFINGFKNDQSYELIDEEILKIHQF